MEKLRKIAWLLVVVLPYFCEAQPIVQTKQKLSEADSLVGAWMISATEHIWVNKSYKSQTTQTTSRIVCNACPMVTFDSNRTGQVISANGFKRPFEWSIYGSELKIVNPYIKKQKPDSILRDGIYSIRISQGLLGEDVLKLFDATATTYVLIRKYP